MNKNLVYFTEEMTDRSKSIGISLIIGGYSPSNRSHKAAWAYLLKNQLVNAGYDNVTVLTSDMNPSWEKFDVVLIDQGMAFNGSFNIFEGAGDVLYNDLIRLFTKEVKLYSIDRDMPCIGELIEKRLKTGTPLFKTLATRMSQAKAVCSTIQRIDRIERTESLCFGDSSSFGQYSPGYMTSRFDGLTLFRALQNGLSTYISEDIKKLRIYLGNVDMRHHIMRQPEPLEAVSQLVKKYEYELLTLQSNGLEDIEVVHTVPICSDSRRLPQTGYYKKTPFYGTWSERTECANLFNSLITEMCERNGWSVWSHPRVYLNTIDELNFDVMEKPQSVHVSREYYRWDFEKNIANPKLISKTVPLF